MIIDIMFIVAVYKPEGNKAHSHMHYRAVHALAALYYVRLRPVRNCTSAKIMFEYNEHNIIDGSEAHECETNF